MKELKTSMEKCVCPNCREDYSNHHIYDEWDCDTLYSKYKCPNCGSEVVEKYIFSEAYIVPKDDAYEALKELDYYEWHK